MLGVHPEHGTGLLPWNKRGTGGIQVGWDVGVRLGMVLLAVLDWDRVAFQPFRLDADQKWRSTSEEYIVMMWNCG